jgi:hypothetical protein
MHKGIVVGVDGSQPSEWALAWAAIEAARRDERRTIVQEWHSAPPGSYAGDLLSHHHPGGKP